MGPHLTTLTVWLLETYVLFRIWGFCFLTKSFIGLFIHSTNPTLDILTYLVNYRPEILLSVKTVGSEFTEGHRQVNRL